MASPFRFSLRSLSTPVAALVIVCVAALLSLGAFVSPTQAQEDSASCPDGTTLSADGTKCLSDAVDDNVVTTNSCLQGVLSADGKTCIVPRIDTPTPAAGTTTTTTSGAEVSTPVPAFTG